MDRRQRLLFAAALGATASVATLILGLPGGGEWLVVCWVAGVLAGAVAPLWAGYGAAVAGIALATVGGMAFAGQYPGLAALVVAAEATILGHGFLVSATVGRAWRIRSLIDPRVLAGAIAAVGILVLLFQLAQDFARNPP